MSTELVPPERVDEALSWQPGRARKLASRGKLPAYRLPDGQIRFRLAEIIDLITRIPSQEATHAS